MFWLGLLLGLVIAGGLGVFLTKRFWPTVVTIHRAASAQVYPVRVRSATVVPGHVEE